MKYKPSLLTLLICLGFICLVGNGIIVENWYRIIGGGILFFASFPIHIVHYQGHQVD